MSQKNLQPGDLCSIVRFTPDQIGYRHNNKVVTLTKRSAGKNFRSGEMIPGWVTDPPLYHPKYTGPIVIAEVNLKPFPKDLLKDEEKHDEELHA